MPASPAGRPWPFFTEVEVREAPPWWCNLERDFCTEKSRLGQENGRKLEDAARRPVAPHIAQLEHFTFHATAVRAYTNTGVFLPFRSLPAGPVVGQHASANLEGKKTGKCGGRMSSFKGFPAEYSNCRCICLLSMLQVVHGGLEPSVCTQRRRAVIWT